MLLTIRFQVCQTGYMDKKKTLSFKWDLLQIPGQWNDRNMSNKIISKIRALYPGYSVYGFFPVSETDDEGNLIREYC